MIYGHKHHRLLIDEYQKDTKISPHTDTNRLYWDARNKVLCGHGEKANLIHFWWEHELV